MSSFSQDSGSYGGPRQGPDLAAVRHPASAAGRTLKSVPGDQSSLAETSFSARPARSSGSSWPPLSAVPSSPAIALPAVGAIGTVVRNSATKFNTLSTPELHQLPVRSEILDRHGKLLAYYYPRTGHRPGPGDLRPDRPGDAPGHRRDRGRPVLRARRDRLPRHRPRAGQRPGAQVRPGRVHAGPAVREERGDPVLAQPGQGVRQRHRGDDRAQDPRTADGRAGRAHDVQARRSSPGT